MTTKKIPLRMCIGCAQMKPKKELIRVVRSPDGLVALDLGGKLPGRGAYLCPSSACLKKAMKSKRLGSTLNCEIPQEVYERLEAQMGFEDQIFGLLSIARKGGNLIGGTDAVKEEILTNGGCVLLAHDLSEKSAKEVRFFLKDTESTAVRLPLTMQRIGDITGKLTGVLCVTDTQLADKIVTLSGREEEDCK